MKKFLAFLLAALMVLITIAGCNPATEESTGETESQGETETGFTSYSEAPELAEKVAAGELDPIEERIPDKDNIYVETVDANGDALEIGTYGGVIRQAVTKGTGYGCYRFQSTYVCRYDCEGTRICDVIKSYDVNEDYTEYTWHLREGLRWSNGDVFDAEAIAFFWYVYRPIYCPNWGGTYQMIDGEKVYAEFTVVDDYTVKFTFQEPQYEETFFSGDWKFAWANKDFYYDKIPSSLWTENPMYEDPGLTEEQAMANMNAAGMYGDSCYSILDTNPWMYYAVPCMDPWIWTTEEGNNSPTDSLMIKVRNPYYFKVDAAGNQLPYADEIHYYLVTDMEQALLKYQSGELDYYVAQNFDEVVTLKASGATNVILYEDGWGHFQWSYNLTSDDANKKVLYNNIDFRQAMSIAIDREAVAELLTDGFLEPMNTSPLESLTCGDKGYEDMWAEYDPEKAVELLEGSCGLKKGSDGWYDFADGSDLEIVVLPDSNDSSSATEMAAIIKYWTDLGLNVVTDMGGNRSAKWKAGDYDIIYIATSDIKGYGLGSRPNYWIPMGWGGYWYASYGAYYNDPETYAEYKPEGDFQTLIDLYEDEWCKAATDEERAAIEEEMFDIILEGGYIACICENFDNYIFLNSNLANVPDGTIKDDKWGNENIMHPWTWFYK